jgi:hypothetical protein
LMINPPYFTVKQFSNRQLLFAFSHYETSIKIKISMVGRRLNVTNLLPKGIVYKHYFVAKI